MAVIERVSAMPPSRQMVLIVTCQSCPIRFGYWESQPSSAVNPHGTPVQSQRDAERPFAAKSMLTACSPRHSKLDDAVRHDVSLGDHVSKGGPRPGFSTEGLQVRHPHG